MVRRPSPNRHRSIQLLRQHHPRDTMRHRKPRQTHPHVRPLGNPLRKPISPTDEKHHIPLVLRTTSRDQLRQLLTRHKVTVDLQRHSVRTRRYRSADRTFNVLAITQLDLIARDMPANPREVVIQDLAKPTLLHLAHSHHNQTHRRSPPLLTSTFRIWRSFRRHPHTLSVKP